MSVVGFDVGNESCIVAVARQRGIDVVLNDESKRETPAVVCFGEKQRFIGTAGAASSLMNPKNAISQIKRLIGKPFSDPDLQRDLKTLPFTVTKGPDDTPLIHARYLGDTKVFSPTQVLAMILSDLKQIAKTNLKAEVVDCCIGIPAYFNDMQRRAVQDAATIANLNPLCLMHETTATALAYGIYKTDLPENDPVNVVFVDIGHASMQVCVAAFKKGQLKVLTHTFDKSLGGRDFDDALFHHFSQLFKEQYQIDVTSSVRASQRLRSACEKLKKVLSANPEAPLNIECLMDEKDVRGFIKREEFERLALPLLERVKSPCLQALQESGLSVEKIHAVEVVGSSSRIPAILKILTETFGKEPRRTMNASECVARGCALQCAILSPTFKVRDFKAQDYYPFDVVVAWKGPAPESEDVASEPNQQLTVVFPKGNALSSTKVLTFFRSGTFNLDILYANPPQRISSYQIGPFKTPNGERAKLKVKITLDKHGIVYVESATMVEEEEIEVPVSSTKEVQKDENKEASATDTDQVQNNERVSNDNIDVNMQDASVGVDGTSAGGSVPANGITGADGQPSHAENDSKPKTIKKKKVKKTDIPVSTIISGGLPKSDLQKLTEKEFDMALQDRVMEETKDKKNAVEAYVYDIRNKLYDKYQGYVTEAEKDELISRLQTVEDWLYDEGEDETKGVYISKLDELRKLGDPIEVRYREDVERGPAINQLLYCINSYRQAAQSNEPAFAHIDSNDKLRVISECSDAESWLNAKKQQQDSLPRHADPVLFASDIKRKAETLDRFCRPIMTKPRPPPPKPQEQPATQPATPSETNENSKNADNGAAPNQEAPSTNQEAPYVEPMETDNIQTPET
eukprot:TRINITY_DN32865_c0_g1_i1.p1 TRINITY_DN32865_c0_g1~~TRINITY_DN32865_c0_g1_i1.p1  ORF type:complete len:858 (-),score=185.61 TRINITY_DN32865_c0_g1_i1:424-2997(-)